MATLPTCSPACKALEVDAWGAQKRAGPEQAFLIPLRFASLFGPLVACLTVPEPVGSRLTQCALLSSAARRCCALSATRRSRWPRLAVRTAPAAAAAVVARAAARAVARALGSALERAAAKPAAWPGRVEPREANAASWKPLQGMESRARRQVRLHQQQVGSLLPLQTWPQLAAGSGRAKTREAVLRRVLQVPRRNVGMVDGTAMGMGGTSSGHPIRHPPMAPRMAAPRSFSLASLRHRRIGHHHPLGLGARHADGSPPPPRR